MKNIIKTLKKAAALVLLVIVIVACNEDFTSLESDIQGAQNFNSSLTKLPIAAYNKKLNPVQTNNLTSNLLGVYNDAVFGTTKAQVVCQIVPKTYSPDFGIQPEIESVMLHVPYYSTNIGTNADGSNIYELDSVFSNNGSYNPIKLSIYKNNYFLRDFNPDSPEDSQNYYSNANQTIDFDAFADPTPLYHSDEFAINNQENVTTVTNTQTGEEEERIITPGIYVDLYNSTTDFWEDTFFFDEIGEHPELSNANNFIEYFRGLYFKTDAFNENGSMLLLNFSAATIDVKYSNVTGTEIDENGNEVDVRTDQVLQFEFVGNRLNIFENDPTNTVIADQDAAANTIDGDNNLYLKGGEGALTVIDLFGNEDTNANDVLDGYEDFLATFKDENNEPKKIINEANLVFHLNNNLATQEAQKPQRLILYDINNNVPIIDYYMDFADASNPENSRILHSVPRKELENGDEVFKIRLTEHLNNILHKDSTNFKLGVYITTNINEVLNTPVLDSDTNMVKNSTPGAILSPKGTVLYGSNPSVAEEKRVQLEIYYTEPNN
ncbi:MAG: DUF4270 domain-containing protein [Oceanihabitans sp.]